MSSLSQLKRDLRPALVSLAAAVVRRNLDRELGGVPWERLSPLEDAEYVVLQLSHTPGTSGLQSYCAEMAMVSQLLARGRRVALCDTPARVFAKKIYWRPPSRLFWHRLWNHSDQYQNFASGLEAQGNALFISALEARFWENKGFMHREFDRLGVATPPTVLLSAQRRSAADLPAAPLLIKMEHSAGSAGIHYFPDATSASRFLAMHTWAPGETLIAQSIVRGSRRDLRLTMVGTRMVRSATYWRIKASAPDAAWTSTASTYNSLIEHGEVPAGLVELAAGHMRRLGLRTAGMDVIYENDDLAGPPLFLEVSPFYQPNPPKPPRYRRLNYKQYKSRLFGKQTYLAEQFRSFLEIDDDILSQALF